MINKETRHKGADCGTW